MSARSRNVVARRRVGRPFAGPPEEDPRVVRTRAAASDAARTLFLRQGYAGTTMDEIASLAGLTKRTLYNHYSGKEALFTEMVSTVIAAAERFALALREEFRADIDVANLHDFLDELAGRLVLRILRPEVIALRRLLIGEAREFPALAEDYFRRAPGRVLATLASGFEHLGGLGLLRVSDGSHAAAQFAYLAAGAPLDRAVLVGTIPPRERLVDSAREGVQTFLARYAAASTG